MTNTKTTKTTKTSKPRGPATVVQLKKLQRALVLHLLDYMTNTPPQKRTAAKLDVVRRVLRDNGCALDAAHKVNPMKSLQALADLNLPFSS